MRTWHGQGGFLTGLVSAQADGGQAMLGSVMSWVGDNWLLLALALVTLLILMSVYRRLRRVIRRRRPVGWAGQS